MPTIHARAGRRCQVLSLHSHSQANLYSLAVVLFAAADYTLPMNQEPQISEELEDVLASLAYESPADRME